MGKRVLIIEDAPAGSDTVEHMLVELGYSIAGQGGEDRAAVKAGTFDIVMLDVILGKTATHISPRCCAAWDGRSWS